MNDTLVKLKERIKSKISELNYNTWFSPILDAHEKTDDGIFIFVVPNKFVGDWINDYYSELIRKELFLLTQVNYRLAFEISTTPQVFKSRPYISTKPGVQLAKQTRSIESLNPKYGFDRFVVGSSNQFAHAACKAVVDLPGGRYNPLFLYGGAGLGKTHLLHAMGLEMSCGQRGYRVLLMSAENFMNELINALRYERMPEFRQKHRYSCDVFLIDDVQFLAGKERTQEEFFHTFNTLHDAQRQIVLTSDKLPKDIEGIESRLRTRFEWGLIADIQPPDLETRIAILRKKAEVSNLECPEDVAMYLASSIRTNVRELEGSLIRINAFASLTGVPLSLNLTKEILGNTIGMSDVHCTIEAIQKEVASFYHLNVSDLKSPRRPKSLSHPRQVAMYLCKKHVRSSFPEIGGKFGGKDHTTVMHACRKIEFMIETDNSLRNEISILEKNILR